MLSCAELVLRLQNLDYVLTMGSVHGFDLKFFFLLFSNKIATPFIYLFVCLIDCSYHKGPDLFWRLMVIVKLLCDVAGSA